MKLGFVSAILDGWTFEGMVDTAAEMGYQCVEVACWPAGKAERRYAGVSHIDVDALDDEQVRYIHSYLKERGVEISALAYYPNTLDGDLEKRAAALGVVQPVLCEINVGEEPQKAGIMADALPELEEHVLARCPHLEMQGLMCLPPVFDAGEAARPYFARLYRLREDMRARTGLPLPHLSMGMSGDFAAAVAEGATLVRIGTDIFGPRPPKVPA